MTWTPQARREALAEWDRRFGGAPWAPCEECGRPIERGTVPHHSGSSRGGLGGRRKHDPAAYRFLCRGCHDKEHF